MLNTPLDIVADRSGPEYREFLRQAWNDWWFKGMVVIENRSGRPELINPDDVRVAGTINLIPKPEDVNA